MIFARIFRFMVAAFYCINLVLLLIALSAPFYNPKYVWLPAFFGLFFKVFLTAHLFFILVFLIGRLRRLALFSILVLVFCVPALVHSIGFKFWAPQTGGIKPLKLMTYNVNSFDFYKDTVYPVQILKTIHSQDPDIICFQEYLLTPQQRLNLISRLKAAGYIYKYEYITEIIKPHNKVGQAIFSRLPFMNVQPIHF